ncbi:MAG: VTT domain-containing protein [Gammaproteobacteria bacterium]
MSDFWSKLRAGLTASPLWTLAGSVLFVAAFLALLYQLGVQDQLVRLLEWVESQGLWAPLLFMAIMAAVVVLVLPGLPLTTGAGFVFGVVEGSVYVVVGTTLGAVIAFLVARYLFGERARRFTIEHARFRLVGEELGQRGGTIVMLTRLVPFFPSKIANYFFGLTPVRLGGFTLGSLVGFIPFSVNNVYVGSIAADLSTLGARGIARTPLEWAVYGAGFVVTILTVFYLNRLARRALARYTGDAEAPKETS